MFEEPNTVCDLIVSDKCRLDNFIGGERSDLSRSRIKRLIEEGNVSVGGRQCARSYSSAEVARLDGD